MMKFSKTFHKRALEAINRIRSGEKFYSDAQLGRTLGISENTASMTICYSKDHREELGDAIAYRGQNGPMTLQSALTSPLNNADRRQTIQEQCYHLADELGKIAINEPDPYIKANYIVAETMIRDAARKIA